MTRHDPLVSIILCVRNGLPHVRDAVESVLSLTYKNYELIVQDGASTDGTLEYLRSIQGLSAVAIVSEPDTGIGQGFNRALRRCTGDVVGSVDADNVLRKDALDIVERSTGQRPDMGALPLDHEPTYEMLARGDSIGVFQFESEGMREALKKVRPTRCACSFSLGRSLRLASRFAICRAKYSAPMSRFSKERYRIAAGQVCKVAQAIGLLLSNADQSSDGESEKAVAEFA